MADGSKDDTIETLRKELAAVDERLLVLVAERQRLGMRVGRLKARAGFPTRDYSREKEVLELADGGTIFLDEVGDLPLELQAKLLRVLQEGEFERVGGSSSIRVDARLIAATNRDLAAEVAAGRYRADLYYRLNVFPVEIPPLRDRPDDVPLLVHHFAMKHGARIGRKINRVSSRAMAALRAYDWPGNVRELQNVIERAVILSKDGQLAPAALLPAVRSSAEGRASRLDEVEKRHILSVLDRTGWRVSGTGGAAEILGLKRTTLDSRMKKLGIVRPGAARPHSSQ